MPDSPAPDEKIPLVEGNRLRCPHCLELGDILVHFRPLERPERFQNELNVIQRHLPSKGGCGHVFSPGEPWVMEKYLSGELIPKSHLDEAKIIIKELRNQLDDYKQIAGERRVEAA
jgi:hypothetical protein